MQLRDRINSDAATCHGKPHVAGTRIMVSVVLDNLASGATPEEIVTDYPSLTVADVRACIAYGADLARDAVLSLRSGTSG